MQQVDSNAEDRRANTFCLRVWSGTGVCEWVCVCARVCACRWAQIRVSWCQKLDGMKLSILSAKKPRGAKSVLKN